MRAPLRSVALLLALLAGPAAGAQSLAFGADLVSRYVWRGYDFGNAAALQPTLTLTAGGTELGTWASYALVPDGALADEIDVWAEHTFALGGAGLTVGVVDYYFPNAGPDFFDLDGEGEGAHFLEPYVSYEGDEALPITLYAAVYAYNDPDHSAYLEASYPFDVAGTELSLTAGLVTGESALYETSGPSVTNLTVRASRDLPISDRFALPLSVAYTLNPTAERSYLVFGLSVGF